MSVERELGIETEIKRSPERLMLSHAAHTEIGLDHLAKNKPNEDGYLTMPERGLYVVIDGMGGRNGSEQVTKFIQDFITNNPPPKGEKTQEEGATYQLCNYVNTIAQSLYESGLEGGATIAMTKVFTNPRGKNFAVCLSVGDARIELFDKDKVLSSVTLDCLDNTGSELGPITEAEFGRFQNWKDNLVSENDPSFSSKLIGDYTAEQYFEDRNNVNGHFIGKGVDRPKIFAKVIALDPGETIFMYTDGHTDLTTLDQDREFNGKQITSRQTICQSFDDNQSRINAMTGEARRIGRSGLSSRGGKRDDLTAIAVEVALDAEADTLRSIFPFQSVVGNKSKEATLPTIKGERNFTAGWSIDSVDYAKGTVELVKTDKEDQAKILKKTQTFEMLLEAVSRSSAKIGFVEANDLASLEAIILEGMNNQETPVNWYRSREGKVAHSHTLISRAREYLSKEPRDVSILPNVKGYIEKVIELGKPRDPNLHDNSLRGDKETAKLFTVGEAFTAPRDIDALISDLKRLESKGLKEVVIGQKNIKINALKTLIEAIGISAIEATAQRGEQFNAADSVTIKTIFEHYGIENVKIDHKNNLAIVDLVTELVKRQLSSGRSLAAQSQQSINISLSLIPLFTKNRQNSGIKIAA